MGSVTSLLEALKARFVELHAEKEDLFWVTKMGLHADVAAARRAASQAEIAYNRFLQDPEHLAGLRRAAADPERTDDERRLLGGWIATFEANVIEDPEARKLAEAIVEREAELERERQAMPLGYVDPATGERVPASSVRLALMMRSDPDEARRRTAFEGLRSIEPFVLERGFLELVRMRNRLARTLGHPDFYAWRLAVVERMDKARLFGILEDLATRTAEGARAQLAAFARRHGPGALEPWNFPYLRSGRVTREMDPYFRLEAALERWGRAFHALGVRYRGATLTLDLLDRPGKYENGFMHGPGLAFFDGGRWRPARINFTANAVVGQPGSGLRATETLFHEGGHAAHFANILADAPCFSHEFAPTSVAYAETQSMFMDSLLGDAAFRTRYATDAAGRPMPMELAEQAIEERQPFRGWEVRAMLTVPFAERALYELPDDELQPERVLEMFRRIERELQGLEAGVRPVLAVPHLLAGESSAYYHGYVLAEMAVHQTRRFFLERDGHLVDNPAIGSDLAEHYWKPGNAVSFDDTLRSLTGSPLTADALVAECNRTVDQAVADAREGVARQRTVPDAPAASGVRLDAHIRVVHGPETVAEAQDGTFGEACERFAGFIRSLEATS
ncbi:MAG: M3 family metallopeptidase [Myxococcota bacterium]